MINLLPENEKREFALSLIQKKVCFILSFILLALLFLMLLLYVLGLYVKSIVDDYKDLVLAQEQQFKEAAYHQTKEQILNTNQQLAMASRFWQDRAKMTAVLEKLSEVTPASIYFTSFAESQEKVAVAGFAQTRDSLFNFKNDLEAEEMFSEVYFSPSSWVKPRDINFSLTFKINR